MRSTIFLIGLSVSLAGCTWWTDTTATITEVVDTGEQYVKEAKDTIDGVVEDVQEAKEDVEQRIETVKEGLEQLQEGKAKIDEGLGG